MRGVGGPLLCISDLLNDVAKDDNDSGALERQAPPDDVSNIPPSDLPKLFQDNFKELNAAFKGKDHSWTALTLKLCYALETANKLIDSTNSNVASLSRTVEELERTVNRGNSAIEAAKDIVQDSAKNP